jgi:Enoyl-(Acyl carrier protein) reductase
VPVAETADAEGSDFDRAIAVNLHGIWSCTKYELRQMRGQGSGAVVNSSSQSGLVRTAGLGTYTASKHAVIGLTKSAALEYAPLGNRINAICPRHKWHTNGRASRRRRPEHMGRAGRRDPVGRLGRAEEIASAVLWLCTPGAAFTSARRSSSTATKPSADEQHLVVVEEHMTTQLNLNDGTTIPQIGFGTLNVPEDRSGTEQAANLTAAAVQQAIEIGYRHIDTAEAGVGRGVATSGVPRGEVHPTSS